MPQAKENTAILIFVRNPEEEAKQKVFLKHIGYKGNEKLARKLNRRITKISRASGIPAYVFNSFKQRGSSFGARLTNAFSDLFEQGFENVIAVGNDCLALTKDHLIKAKQDLENHETVLGPSKDGGFYLMGLSKKAFHFSEFQALSWNTNRLFKDFGDYIQSNKLRPLFYEFAQDIDNASDLREVLNSSAIAHKFRRELERIIASFHRIITIFRDLFSSPSLKLTLSLRAPPID